MRAILAALLMSSLAFADPPKDAPLDLDAPGRALVLDAGDMAPFSGVLLDEQEDRSRERARVRVVTELEVAHGYAWIPKPLLITLVAVNVLLFAAVVGVGVDAAQRR